MDGLLGPAFWHQESLPSSHHPPVVLVWLYGSLRKSVGFVVLGFFWFFLILNVSIHGACGIQRREDRRKLDMGLCVHA